MKKLDNSQARYSYEKCADCSVTWKVDSEGKAFVITPTCAPTHICLKCIDAMCKLGKAAVQAEKRKAKAEKEAPVVH